ncbi:hypothetical protein EV127DRAFT_410718 [Xylaria flabelliformis]|nr:hypothetical protein EV127DRAFT_410718 [Xylaria flabelliformis]
MRWPTMPAIAEMQSCSQATGGSAYDLTVRSEFTGTPLVDKEALRTGSVKVEYWQAALDKKLALDQPLLETLATELNATGSVIVDVVPYLADASVELSQDPLTSQRFTPITRNLSSRLRALGISNNFDSSGASIGKRYARNDELGTPLGIMVEVPSSAHSQSNDLGESSVVTTGAYDVVLIVTDL